MMNTRLREARKSLNMTIAKFAQRLELKPGTYGTYERGTKIPSLENQVRIYEFLIKQEIPIPEAGIFPDFEKKGRALVVLPDEELDAVEEIGNAEKETAHELVLELLGRLKESERRTVKMRYGVLGYNPHTFEEIGEDFGITKEGARQKAKTAVKKLARYAGFLEANLA